MIITTAAIFIFAISAAAILPRQVDFALMATASMVELPVGRKKGDLPKRNTAECPLPQPEICQGDYG